MLVIPFVAIVEIRFGNFLLAQIFNAINFSRVLIAINFPSPNTAASY
jgi:hypothetical protein